MSSTRPHPAAGIALIVAAAACFASMDTTLRYLGAFIGIALMLWLRYAMHTVVMTAWIALSVRRLRTRPTR